MENGSNREAAAPDKIESGGGPIEQFEATGKKLLWASLGAFAELCDVAGKRFDEFVNRGQQVEAGLQEKADEMRHQNAGARGRVQDSFRGAMDVFLNGFSMPSKGDVDTINMKLNILSRKLDDLQMDRVGAAGGPEAPPPPPPEGSAT
jgi:polyhydroxyalkanoate synthesis regulator phasin